MNMVSILVVPMALVYDKGVVETVKQGAQAVTESDPAHTHFTLPDSFAAKPIDAMFLIVVAVSAVALIWSVWQSKRETGSDQL